MLVNESEGAIAQLGERCNRTAEVVSSNLIGSTNQNKHLAHPPTHFCPEGHAVRVEALSP